MARLTYQWEPMSRLLDEPNVGDLLHGHWEEVGVHKDQMPLDPDFERYVELNEAGLYRVWTARDGDMLAGYIGWFVQPHLHHRRTLTAVQDLYLLSPSHRRGLAGYHMFTSAFDALRDLGVKRVIGGTVTGFEPDRGGLSRVFERLGFENTELVWSRML